ncbi:LamG domain-containing protein [bacterium]|nr:LamG domain-containing protein [bacterium]
MACFIFYSILSCTNNPSTEFKIILTDPKPVSLVESLGLMSAPVNLSGLNCVGVVLGYRQEANKASCVHSVSGDSVDFSTFGGLTRYKSGQSNSIAVPGVKLGKEFDVHVFGLNSTSTVCPNLGPQLDIGDSNYSSPYYLGETQSNGLSGNGASVEVTLSFNSSEYLEDCSSLLWAEGEDLGLAAGLLAYFDFENFTANGSPFTDFLGQFTFSDSGDVDPTASGKIGLGLIWAASGNIEISSGSISPLNFSGANDVKTYSFWYKYTSGAPTPSVVAGIHGSTNGLSVGFGSVGNLAINYGDSSIPSQVECVNASCASSVANNTWAHFVVVVDIGNSKVKFYVNGSFVLSTNAAIALASIDNTSDPFRIGSDATGASLLLPTGSLLDMLGIWERELTASEISQLYNAGAGVNLTSLLAL